MKVSCLYRFNVGKGTPVLWTENLRKEPRTNSPWIREDGRRGRLIFPFWLDPLWKRHDTESLFCTVQHTVPSRTYDENYLRQRNESYFDIQVQNPVTILYQF